MSKTNTKTNIFGLIKKGEYKYEYIRVDKKGEYKYEYNPGDKKRANTNTNMNIQTDICEYEYKYEYLSHTALSPQVLHVLSSAGHFCPDSCLSYVHLGR